MAYACDIGNRQRLLVQNDGDSTQVALSSGGSGQHQNQSTGFTTGEWSKPPELFRTRESPGIDAASLCGCRRSISRNSLYKEPELEQPLVL